jgi:hypothetical protein
LDAPEKIISENINHNIEEEQFNYDKLTDEELKNLHALLSKAAKNVDSETK